MNGIDVERLPGADLTGMTLRGMLTDPEHATRWLLLLGLGS
jgi:hypothetical protein